MKIIKERLFKISQKDINHIITEIETTVFKLFPNWDSINTNFFKQNSFSSEILVYRVKDFIYDSIELQTVKEDFPIEISLGMLRSGNVMYPPLSLVEKTPYIINVGFHLERLKEIKTIVLQNKLQDVVKFSELENLIAHDIYVDVVSYFNIDRLRNALTHELTHLLDDYYNNQAVRKNIILRKFNNETEINAQIHVIAMLKLRNEAAWDKLTIFDILSKDQSLKDVYRRLSSIDKKEALKWIRVLMKRLYREGILGKNMNFIPTNDIKLMEDFYNDAQMNERFYDLNKYL